MSAPAPDDAAEAACVRRRALERRAALLPPELDGGRPFWLVTVTLSGPQIPEELVRYGLERLNQTRAFLVSTRYDEYRAEVRYWDEGATAAEPVWQALELWGEEDVSELLPGWALTGLGVVDHEAARRQWLHGQHPRVFALGEILPFDEQVQLA